jgi:hypothetical protein
MEEAIIKFPEAKLIVFQHECDYGNNTVLKSILGEDKLIYPKEALEMSIFNGNWFGDPISCLIHKDAVKDYFNFGQIDWVADMQFGLNLISKYPTAFIAKKIGVFNVAARNFYLKYSNSIWADIEDYVIRKQAAEKYNLIASDFSHYKWLIQHLETNLFKKIDSYKNGLDSTDVIKKNIYEKLNIIDLKFENNSCVNCIIWGAGNGGRLVKEAIENSNINYNVIAFVDKYKTGTFEGKKIILPEALLNIDADYIFIATTPGKIEAQAFLKKNLYNTLDNFIDLI